MGNELDGQRVMEHAGNAGAGPAENATFGQHVAARSRRGQADDVQASQQFADPSTAGAILAQIRAADRPTLSAIISALERARSDGATGVDLPAGSYRVAPADIRQLEQEAIARHASLPAAQGPSAAQPAPAEPEGPSAIEAAASAEEWVDVGQSFQVNRTLFDQRTRGPGFVYVRKAEIRGTLRLQHRGSQQVGSAGGAGGGSAPAAPAGAAGGAPGAASASEPRPGGLQRTEITGIGYNTGGVGRAANATDRGPVRGRYTQARAQATERYQWLNQRIGETRAAVSNDVGVQATGGAHNGSLIGSVGINSTLQVAWPSGNALAFAPEFRFIDRGDGTKLAEFGRLLLNFQGDLNHRFSDDPQYRATGRLSLIVTIAPGERFMEWVARNIGQRSADLLRQGTTAAANAAGQAGANAAERTAVNAAANATEQAGANATTNVTERAAANASTNATERTAANATTNATERAAANATTNATERAAANATTNATERAAANATTNAAEGVAARAGGEAAVEAAAGTGARTLAGRAAGVALTAAELIGFLDLPLQITIWNLWMWQHAWAAGRHDSSLAGQVQRDLFNCCLSFGEVITGGTPRSGRPGADGAHAAERRIANAVAQGYSREAIFTASRQLVYQGHVGVAAWYKQCYETMAPRARAAGAAQEGFVDIVGLAIEQVDAGAYGYRHLGGP